MSVGRLQILQSQYQEDRDWALAFMDLGGEGLDEAKADWAVACKRLAAIDFLIKLELNPNLTSEERVNAFVDAQL